MQTIANKKKHFSSVTNAYSSCALDNTTEFATTYTRTQSHTGYSHKILHSNTPPPVLPPVSPITAVVRYRKAGNTFTVFCHINLRVYPFRFVPLNFPCCFAIYCIPRFPYFPPLLLFSQFFSLSFSSPRTIIFRNNFCNRKFHFSFFYPATTSLFQFSQTRRLPRFFPIFLFCTAISFHSLSFHTLRFFGTKIT